MFLLGGEREILGILKEYIAFLKKDKRVILLGSALMLRNFSMNLLMVIVPLWLVYVKGLTAVILGLVTTVSSAVLCFSQYPAGKLADRFGNRRTFLPFTALYCLAILILIWAPSVEYIFLASILGFGLGGVGGTAFTIFITMWFESTSPESRGRQYGFDQILWTISVISSSLIAGYMWDMGFGAFALSLPVFIEAVVIVLLFISR